jgi:hypothetical protein
LGTTLEDAIGRDAESIGDREELAELIEQGQSKTGIATQLDLYFGKGRLQTRHQAQQHGHNTGMTGGTSRAQSCRQQASGVTLEDEHGVIHVLAVSAVEEAELLLAMSGIVGGVDVEQNLATRADLITANPDELLAQQIVVVCQIASGRRVFPATERGLRTERVA